jgi:hypothetical protein
MMLHQSQHFIGISETVGMVNMGVCGEETLSIEIGES